MILSTAFRPNFFVSCLLVLLATQSATLPASDVSTGIPVVLDKDNKVVGPVLDFVTPRHDFPLTESEYIVSGIFIDEVPLFFEFRAKHDRLIGGNSEVYYENNDCSGTPLIRQPSDAYFASGYLFTQEPELVAYVEVDGSAPSSIYVQGYQSIDGKCTALPAGNQTLTLVEAVRVPTGFVGPFKLGQGPGLATMQAAFAVPVFNPLVGLLLALVLLGLGYRAFQLKSR